MANNDARSIGSALFLKNNNEEKVAAGADLKISNDLIMIIYDENEKPLKIADIKSGLMEEINIEYFRSSNIQENIWKYEFNNHSNIKTLFRDLDYLENSNFKVSLYSTKLTYVVNINQIEIPNGSTIKKEEIINESLRSILFEPGDGEKIELLNKFCMIVYENMEMMKENELRSIKYSSENLFQLDRNVFKAFTNLQSINLSFSKIDALDENMFKNLGHLEEINFSFNSINRIESGLFNSDLVELKSIELHDNDIVKLPPDFSQHLKKLVRLNVSHNQISSLDANIFASCECLEEVYFNSNLIRELNRSLFEKNKRLVKIKFDDNKISNLPHGIFMNCEMLSEISFARNNIEKLDSSIFRGQLNLTKIDFSHNQISELSPGIFVGLKKLVKVNFSYNKITRLHSEIFDDFLVNQSLKSIDFRCDYKSINIFSTWDYQRVYDEFFKIKTPEGHIVMRKDVYEQYLIMFSLSKQEITLTVLGDAKNLESFLKNHITNHHNSNSNPNPNDNDFNIPKDYFDENKFTLLDFLLLCNGITSKMLFNILEKLNKNENHEFPFKVTKKESVEHLCKHGNEKLIIEIIMKSFRVLPVILLSLLAFSFAFRVSAKSNEIVDLLPNCKNKLNCSEKEDVIEFYNGTREMYAYNMVRLLTMSLGEYSTFQMGLFGNLDFSTIITNYIAYVLFILVLPILAINMFIGISVDEMRKLFEKSESQNIKNKIEYVLSIQNVLDKNTLARFCIKPLMALVNTCCNQDNKIDEAKKTKKKSSDDILKKSLGIVKRIENRIEDIQNEMEVAALKQKAEVNEKFWKLDEQFSRFDARLTKLEESAKFAADVNKVSLKKLFELEELVKSIADVNYESLKKLNELEEWVKLLKVNKRKNKK